MPLFRRGLRDRLGEPEEAAKMPRSVKRTIVVGQGAKMVDQRPRIRSEADRLIEGRRTIVVPDRQLASSLTAMSLAHLRALKSERTRTAGAAAVERATASPNAAYCGASHEPVYRTMDEATASGLELCDSCLADFRKQRKVH